MRVASRLPRILLQKSFGGDERNFLGPLNSLRALRREGTTLLIRKSTTELRIGAGVMVVVRSLG